MTNATFNRNLVAAFIKAGSCSDQECARGLAYADEQGASDDYEAASLAMSRILYADVDLAEGARFGVEPGSLDEFRQ